MNIKKSVKNILAYSFYKRNKNKNGMLRNLKELNENVNNASLLYIQANLEYQKKSYNNSIKTLKKLLDLLTNNDKLLNKSYLLLADNYYKMNDYKKSLEFYFKTLNNTEIDSYVYYSISKIYFIEKNYHKALDILNEVDKSYLDINVEYLKYKIMSKTDDKHLLNQINLLLDKFNDKLSDKEISDLYYAKGNVLLDNDELSNHSYKKSIKSIYKNFSWIKLAELHEQKKNWLGAIKSYNEALELSQNDDALHFKIGKLYGEKLNDYKSAINHVLIAIENNKTLSPYYFHLAKYYYYIKDYNKAELYLENAIKYQQHHRPYNYKVLSDVKQKLGKYDEANSLLKEADLFMKPFIASQGQYKNNIDKIEVRYSYFWDYYKVNPKVIFYENMSGTSMMGDPYAIFLDIINRDNDFIHVWALNSFNSIPKEFKTKENIIFVKKNSDAYAKYLCIAKYLVCNSTFSPFFTKKNEQKYLQTTHGIFYKTVGKDNASNPFGVAGSTRNLLQATHILAPNKYMLEKEQDAYSIRDIHQGDIGLFGYPRIDLTLNLPEKRKEEIINTLGIDDTKDVLSYLPTWRGASQKSTDFEIERLLLDLQEMSKLDINIIFRGHPITSRLLKNVNLPKNIIMPNKDISTNELLAVTDICISDYSSVFFDFIPTKRPIIHYIYDLEEYKSYRGLNLTEEELPGTVVKNQEDLIEVIEYYKQNKTPSDRYIKALERFCPFDKGESSKKVVDWFLYNKNNDIEIKKYNDSVKKELYILGNNVSEKMFKQTVEEILSKPTVKSSVILQVNSWKDKDVLKELEQIQDKVNFIPHAGKPVFNIKEKAYISILNKEQTSQLKDVKEVVNKGFKREALRLIGNTSFDSIKLVDAGLQNTYWNTLAQVLIKNNK